MVEEETSAEGEKCLKLLRNGIKFELEWPIKIKYFSSGNRVWSGLQHMRHPNSTLSFYVLLLLLRKKVEKKSGGKQQKTPPQPSAAAICKKLYLAQPNCPLNRRVANIHPRTSKTVQ
jgi:hypothetical protein